MPSLDPPQQSASLLKVNCVVYCLAHVHDGHSCGWSERRCWRHV